MAASALDREATRIAVFATAAVIELESLVARGADVQDALAEARNAGLRALRTSDQADA